MPTDHTTPLARRIVSAEQLTPLSDDALRALRAEHDAEILSLQGRIEVVEREQRDPLWLTRARQALRTLRMHRVWIGQEQAARATAAARAARLARIQASTAEDARHTAVFKAVAHEVLGDEMYQHLWQLTQQRLGQTAA